MSKKQTYRAPWSPVLISFASHLNGEHCLSLTLPFDAEQGCLSAVKMGCRWARTFHSRPTDFLERCNTVPILLYIFSEEIQHAFTCLRDSILRCFYCVMRVTHIETTASQSARTNGRRSCQFQVLRL